MPVPDIALCQYCTPHSGTARRLYQYRTSHSGCVGLYATGHRIAARARAARWALARHSTVEMVQHRHYSALFQAGRPFGVPLRKEIIVTVCDEEARRVRSEEPLEEEGRGGRRRGRGGHGELQYCEPRNQLQETAVLVQVVLRVWLCAFDFAVLREQHMLGNYRTSHSTRVGREQHTLFQYRTSHSTH
eukprot:1270175-Rhodomonas_salina.3